MDNLHFLTQPHFDSGGTAGTSNPTGTITLNGSTFEKKKKKGRNQATVKKMIIADPSVGFGLNLDCPDFLNQINQVFVTFKLGPAQNDYKHHSEYRLTYGGLPLNISKDKDIICVMPFVDPWFGTEPNSYYYYFDIQVFTTTGNLETFIMEGSVPAADVKQSVNFQFSLDPAFHNPPSLPTPQPEDVKITDLLFHTEGCHFKIQLPASTDNKVNPCNIYFNRNTENGPDSWFCIRPVIKPWGPVFNLSTEASFVWLSMPQPATGETVPTWCKISVDCYGEHLAVLPCDHVFNPAPIAGGTAVISVS